MNGLLGYISPVKNHAQDAKFLFGKEPNKVIKDHNIFYRPHLDQLINTLFIKVIFIKLEKILL